MDTANADKTQPSKRRRCDTLDEVVIKDIFLDLSFESDAETECVNDLEGVSETCNVNVIEEPKKRVRNKFNWVKHSEWDSFDAALDYLEEQSFVLYDDKTLKMGQKFYFRCRKRPKSVKPYCASQCILFLPSNSNLIILLHNGNVHNHNEIMKDKKRMLSDEMIDYIYSLFDKGVILYDKIIEFVEESRDKHGIFINEPNPEPRQIEYRLSLWRNSNVKPMINLGDLMEFCNNNAEYPVNDNEAFILASECSSISDELHFKFCYSTANLLKKFIGLKTICIDATYKLNWNGFPLIVFGTVDRGKKFHPLLYACTSHETSEDYSFVFETVKNCLEVFYEASFEPTTLIADGAISIRNAFYGVFESANLDIMCFAHVIRNIRKRPFSNKNNKQLVIEDIRKLQSAPNRDMFEKMAQLFCEKWENIEPNFIEYFKNQWLGSLVNWFEGAAAYTPSTNNALESHNATIKRRVTLRRRLPLNQFLQAMKELTEYISLQFHNDKRIIVTEPTIKKLMTNAAALMFQNKFKCFKAKISTDNELVFLVPSQHCEEVNANEKYYRSLVKRQWKSFDEFITHGFQMFYIVHLSTTSWNIQSSCRCVLQSIFFCAAFALY